MTTLGLRKCHLALPVENAVPPLARPLFFRLTKYLVIARYGGPIFSITKYLVTAGRPQDARPSGGHPGVCKS